MYNMITRNLETELIPACQRYGLDIVVYNRSCTEFHVMLRLCTKLTQRCSDRGGAVLGEDQECGHDAF